MQQVKQYRRGRVFLGGLIDENGAQVIKDKVRARPERRRVKLLAPDGFTQQSTIDEAGVETPRHVPASIAGVPTDD